MFRQGGQGVRGRNSDNTRLREVLGWEPSTPLEVGLVPTYEWINKMVKSRDPLATLVQDDDEIDLVRT